MGLNHDFLLINKSDFTKNGYKPFFNSKKAILLHDDFIDYIYDTLLWIPSVNEKGIPMNPTKGLNRWGVNLYEMEGAYKLKSIISSWIEIFKNGPDKLNLKGAWSYYNEEKDNYENEGHYERLLLNRDELIKKLSTIVNWADEVISSNGKRVILHLGI